MSAAAVENRAEAQARAQVEAITELHARYLAAEAWTVDPCPWEDEDNRPCSLTMDHDGPHAHIDEVESADRVEDEARDLPLSVQIRSGWYHPGLRGPAAEYELLLCTGGPAVRITGELDGYGQPDDWEIEYGDWGTEWTRVYSWSNPQIEALDWFVGLFYYGEG